MPTKILIIAANPWDTEPLGLDEEYREIKDIWQKSKQREQFILEYAPAIREEDLRQALLDFEPNIIHFSGHGGLEGLFFMDDSGNSHQINKQALANLFSFFSNQIICVVLNACYSKEQAMSIAEHIDHVIGMTTAIGDKAAIKFSTGFYQALFNGKEIEFAYNFACNTIDLSNIPEKDTPKLITKQQADAEPVENYLFDYQYDVLVHVSDKECVWADTLVQQLQKHLTQRFSQTLNLQLQTNNEVQYTQAATNLILLSPAYIAKNAENLNSLTLMIKQKRLFLADYQPIERPQALNGLLSYCFWQFDPTQGLYTQTPADLDYSLQVENLAQDIEKRLKYLHQQQQLKAKQAELKVAHILNNTATTTTTFNDSLVFVNVAVEDRLVAKQVQQSLARHDIASTLPIDQSLNPLPSDIRRDIEINLLNCDAVLVIYVEGSPSWIKEQLLMCHRWQRKREEPLKIFALHNQHCDTSFDDLSSVHIPNLKVFCCPPESIDSYLVGFMKALK